MDKSNLESMRRSFHVLNERKEELFKNKDFTELRDNVKGIRRYSVNNLKNLIKTAKNSFEDNGIEVIFAEDSKKALDEIYKIVKDERIVAKSKSNTANEIGLSNFLKTKDIEVIETDLGDRIVQLDPEEKRPSHPIGPASHLNTQKISKIISEKFGTEVKPEPRTILELIRSDVLRELLECKVGITGANSVAAEDGSLVLVHNEGNISLVSMLDTHIAVIGVDKLVRTIEEAISVVKLETIYATGKTIPSYMNVISSSSKTADIEQMLLKGMYGAKRVVIIFIDNGRSKLLKENEECLLCVGCGSCIVTCPVYNAIGYEFGYKGYLGGRGVAFSRFIKDMKTSFDSGLFSCTLCGLCTIECPVSIPTNEMVEKLRAESVKSEFSLKKHREVTYNIRNRGSPF